VFVEAIVVCVATYAVAHDRAEPSSERRELRAA
jgi:hypothetical protein